MSAARFAVVEGPISAAELATLVAAPGNGAVCTFEGTVRDHTGDRETTFLEYEAHETMAARVFGDIAAAASARWRGADVAIHHRVGRLQIGDVSVAIAVGAEHRDAAFAACRFAIDQLKASAPIWKKEFGPGGSYWVEGPAAAPVGGDGAVGPECGPGGPAGGECGPGDAAGAPGDSRSGSGW